MDIPTIDLAAGDPMPTPERVALDAAVMASARDIITQVRADGDAALVALTQRFDHCDISGQIKVSEDALAAAAAELDPALRDAIDAMADRLRDLHARQVPAAWETEQAGVTFGEVVKPVAAAGCYVPGGRASYPSTVLMTVIPAKVAGVPRVVLCSPPGADGTLPAAVRYAATVAGADAVYRVGGAHAIAALAYGTETIAPVDVIVGPGNAWVTAAKAQLTGVVGIDALAGPSELVIIADATADPAVLAVDLVAQAEHDPEARTTLVALDRATLAATLVALEEEVATSPRREIVEAAMQHALIVLASSREEAAAVADQLAPEHLQIVTDDPRAVLAMVRSYGAAFLGPATPVSFGDYGVGSNHVLPTMANARFSSGLRASNFVTVSSVVEATAASVEQLGPQVETIALAEGLDAHAKAPRIRRSSPS